MPWELLTVVIVVAVLALGWVFYRSSVNRRRTATAPVGEPVAAPGAYETRRSANSLVIAMGDELERARLNADFLEASDEAAAETYRLAITRGQEALDSLTIALQRTADIDYTVNGPTASRGMVAVNKAIDEVEAARAQLTDATKRLAGPGSTRPSLAGKEHADPGLLGKSPSGRELPGSGSLEGELPDDGLPDGLLADEESAEKEFPEPERG